jgi:glutathione S-transferase
MLKLYHVPGSRSVRVRWFLEERGLDYELETMPFEKTSLQSPEYLKKNPFGKVPALDDGDATLFESGAILEYLMEKYGDGGLKPATGGKDWERYLIWMHGSESFAWQVAMYFLNTRLIAEKDRSEAIIADVRSRLMVVLAGAESELNGRAYICGDKFTAADIMFTYGILFASHFDVLNNDDHPNLLSYFDRMKTRGAFQRATAD